MKRSFVLAALLAVSGAHASPPVTDAPASVRVPSTTLTRAEVKAETLRALRAGEVSFGDVDRPRPMPSAPGRTRAEVEADLSAARAAHTTTFSDASYPEPGIATVPRAKGATRAWLASVARRLGGTSRTMSD